MKKGYIHITFLLDKSGSMQNIKSDTIGSFNSFLSEQKGVAGNCTLSLIQFDDKYEQDCKLLDINDVKNLDEKSYIPRGWTKLLDALGRSINETGEELSKLDDKDKPEDVLFVVLTDGQENASQEFDAGSISRLIENQTNKYSWKFLFLGANQDAFSNASKYGIKSFSNSMSFDANQAGITNAVGSLSSSVARYRTATSDRKSSYKFFKKEDRDKQEINY